MPIQTNAFSYWQAGDANKTIVTDGAAFERMLRHLQSGPALTIDYETSGTAWHAHARSIGAGFSTWDRDSGRVWNYYVPYRHRTGEKQLDFDVVAPGIKGLLGDESLLKIAQNIKFEDHFSRREGWSIEGPRYDTMIAGHLYDENMPLKLETRAMKLLRRTDARRFEQEMQREVQRLARAHKLGIKKYKYQHGYEHTSINLCGTYCCFDVDHTTNLYFFYERWGLSSKYTRIWPTEMELTAALCDMEENGLPVDVEYLENLRDSLGGVKAGIYDRIQSILGPDMFNLGSDDELRYFMFRKMRLAPFKKTRGNKWSVDREVLEYFKDRNPILKMLLDWRDADKLENTYTTSILSKLDKYNIVHPDFQQVGANTGRLSCKEPNFQNQPTDDDDRAKEFSGKSLEEGGIDPWSIRRAFVVRKDGVRIIPRLFFDYSQVELRMLAYYSGDELMHQVYVHGAEGGDIHALVAKEVGCPRRTAKVINFGLCLAGGQRVLTQKGLVPIEQITTNHLLWDGIDFVSHDGIVCNGEQEVVTYDGITATPDHEVYTEEGERKAIWEFASGLDTRRLAVGAVGTTPINYFAFDRKNEDAAGWQPRTMGESSSSRMFELFEETLGIDSQYQRRTVEELSVSERKISRSESLHLGATLRRDGAALLQRYACFFPSIQGARHQSVVQFQRTLHSLGFAEISHYGFYGIGFRQGGQRRALLSRELEVSHSFSESEEHYERQTRKTAKVYDILNAGPRHRFTVEGKIVSNSYCLTDVGLARQAKMDPEQAKAFMETFFARFPGIPALRERLWTSIQMNPELSFTNLFGRTRRLPLINSPEQWEQGRAKRQAIGSLIQGSANELAKESIVRVRRYLREEKLPAMLVNTVHDEVQLDCPAEVLVPVVRGVKYHMENYPEFYPIPIVVDGDYTTTSWADKQSLPT